MPQRWPSPVERLGLAEHEMVRLDQLIRSGAYTGNSLAWLIGARRALVWITQMHRESHERPPSEIIDSAVLQPEETTDG